MDTNIKKEINKLKNEIISKESAIETEKYLFEKQLLNGMGDEIKNYFNNPPKESFILKLKIKYARWLKKYKEKKLYKKRNGEF